MKRSCATLAAAVIGAGLSSGAAFAQVGPSGITNGLPTGPVVGGSAPAPGEKAKQAPPPALPGSRVDNAGAAPIDRPPSEMRPTEALFDAVNRGDIAAARDALGRGAELDARNVLGLTPAELSIDLGRNDITFLLLSMRGAAGGPPATQTAHAAPPSKGEKALRRQAAHTVPVRAAATVAATRPAPTAARQQYADVPGTAAPQSGFLGFGGATATR